MKVARLTAIRQVEVGEAAGPRLASPRDVLLRIETVGICGSDIHYYTQGRIGAQVVEFPFTVGHECAGIVVETGAEVRGLLRGQRVAIDPLLACGCCDQCLAGRRHTCRNQWFLGSAGQLPGALQEFMTLPAECCFPVPDSMTAAQAAVVEPLSVGLYATRLAELPPQAKIGILGSGPIGLCVLLAARARGDCKVYVTDLLDNRLDLARRCGSNWTGNAARERVVREIMRMEPLGLDCVFECAGEQETLDHALELLKPAGKLMIVGIPEVDRVSFNIDLLRRKELSIQNVRRQNHCIAPAIEMIAAGAVNVDPLVTHHFQLGETARAFQWVAERRDGVVKAIIHISPEA